MSYYVEMYNFPEDQEWKNKELYFPNIQRAVKYFNDFKENYECVTIGDEILDPNGNGRKRVKRTFYERIIRKDGTIRIKDNRTLFNLKTLNKI